MRGGTNVRGLSREIFTFVSGDLPNVKGEVGYIVVVAALAGRAQWPFQKAVMFKLMTPGFMRHLGRAMV